MSQQLFKPNFTYRRINVEVGCIIDAFFQWHVERVTDAFAGASLFEVACTGEEVTIPVKAHRHHSVRCVKGFFDTVTMMDINVDIEDSVVILEQFKYC